MRILVFLGENIILMGENWCFSQEMLYFSTKLVFLGENAIFSGENCYLWEKMSYFQDKFIKIRN